ncbi:unnamed protein product [Schistosoma turkestanicum]|nr:unnamed protein product [Schistosoma turkestanicum]
MADIVKSNMPEGMKAFAKAVIVEAFHKSTDNNERVDHILKDDVLRLIDFKPHEEYYWIAIVLDRVITFLADNRLEIPI